MDLSNKARDGLTDVLWVEMLKTREAHAATVMTSMPKLKRPTSSPAGNEVATPAEKRRKDEREKAQWSEAVSKT